MGIEGSATKFSNLDRSGQKWALAPLSMIAPSLAFGTLIFSAAKAKSEVQKKAKSSSFGFSATFADSVFFEAVFPGPCPSFPPPLL
jgi:hypothetical protein